jgi:hypothetical protein
MNARRTLATALLVIAGAAVSAGQQVFRARVDAVVVDVLVTERNRPVRGLTARDFELTDNGVPQQIAAINGESLPLDATLVLDMSGRGILQPSLVAAANKVRQSLRPGDRVRIITFTDAVKELTPLVVPASAPPLPPLPALTDFVPIGQTACYDAIALSIAMQRITGRRQLAILFSAGRDDEFSRSPSGPGHRTAVGDGRVRRTGTLRHGAPGTAP